MIKLSQEQLKKIKIAKNIHRNKILKFIEKEYGK